MAIALYLVWTSYGLQTQFSSSTSINYMLTIPLTKCSLFLEYIMPNFKIKSFVGKNSLVVAYFRIMARNKNAVHVVIVVGLLLTFRVCCNGN